MKFLILFFISFSVFAISDSEYYKLLERMQKDNATSIFFNTPKDLIASKCRLRLPIKKKQCEEAGVMRTKGGQLEGLPVSQGDYKIYYSE